jgi:hypothetical protein
MKVAPPKVTNPNNSGNLLLDDRSAYHPANGEDTSSAAPYTASKIETQLWTDDWATPARDDNAKGITGTMIPYRKMSVNTATHIVVRMNAFEDLSGRRYGGGEVESRRAPERKFFILPMIY